MKLTSIKIRFGSIALSKARNVQILYKGFEIQIEEISLNSNFFNSEISNPVQIFFKDVRINKNIETCESNIVVRKSTKSFTNEPIKQIPSFLVTFFQVGFLLIFIPLFLKSIFSSREFASQTFRLYCSTMQVTLAGGSTRH
jgi:hypothetical protein